MKIERAYSLLTVKSVQEDARTITGIATTPATDRVGDVVESKGAQFKLPIALLWQHDSAQPIGKVTAAKVTPDGIEVTAQIASVPEAGRLRDRLDEAWQSIKSGLVGGLSIGFRALPGGAEMLKDGSGIRYMKWMWLELSAVTIPANHEATITAIKSIDQQQRAASGAAADDGPPPGASGTQQQAASGRLFSSRSPKGTTMKTIAEQIADFQARRTAAQEKMLALTTKSAEEGATFDEHDSEEFDGAQAEIDTIDKHVARLKAVEAISIAKATPIAAAAGTSEQSAVALRAGGSGVLSVRRNLPPGIAFARFAIAQAIAKGNPMMAEKIAEQRWKDTTPEVAQCLKAAVFLGGTADFEANLKAAVAAGSTSDSTWAAPLVYYNNMTAEFIELLRPATIIGKLNSLRKVPFNIRIPRQTAGTAGSFVGEGAPKPVGKLSFDALTLNWAKAAVIVVFTGELQRFSDPSIEALARDDMVKGISQYLDDRFINPTYAGTAGVSPASITNGVTARTATGATISAITTDVTALMSNFATNNLNLTTGAWIMNPNTALKLSMVRNAFDAYDFPTINVQGGTWFGLPVVVSNNTATSVIALIDQQEILMADDGQVSIDMSQEAAVQMTDSPTAGAVSLVSLWQNNLIGLRAERYINWVPRRAAAVAVLTGVVY